jgi:DNA-binding NarL/FixJ family response regulator
LIADDHEFVRQRIKQLLIEEFKEISITEVADTQELLFQAALKTWDFIISDINMPGGNGLDAVKSICQQFPTFSIIVVSINDEQLYGSRALMAGAKAYIQKENLVDQLLPIVKKLLSLRSTKRRDL